MKKPKVINQIYKSGFASEIILKPEFNQKFMGIIVDFGSSDPQEVAGSAHFLEHKLFSKKDGDLSQKFEDLGADVNAFTSFNETMYYCSGVDHVRKLIQLLFQLVGEPYFTKKNVKNEIPIIQQELAMYQNSPNWIITNTLMSEMFNNSKLAIDVVGTQDTIAQMTVSKLKQVYEANYFAKNMRFVTAGDFSETETQMILNLVDKLQRKYFHSLKQEVSPNHNRVIGKFGDIKLAKKAESNLFGVGLYLPNFAKIKNSLDLAQIVLEIMLEAKLGIMSSWYKDMRKKGLLTTPLQISVNYTRQGNFVTIYGVSEQSKKAISAIKSEIDDLFKSVDTYYLKEYFELKKKDWLAQTIRSLNDLSYLAIERAEEMLGNENLFTNIQNLQLMNFDNFISSTKKLMHEYQACSAYFAKED